MKKLTLLFTVFFAAFYINAQNVAINNDGTTADASAMLDVKSTTKGFLMPRVTSAQRAAISSPALGLLVFDTDTKTIWAHNGTAWVNLSAGGSGGSGFTLPFYRQVEITETAFEIRNISGQGIKGIGTIGVEGKSNSGYGVRGQTSTSDVNGAAVYALNSGSKGNGVLGVSHVAGSNGVHGTSNNGTGVLGYSNSYRGVAGSTISGTALYGNSTSGYGLEVSGKVKISGGNTNPENGAVLTSDANGNAVWKKQRIGFKAIWNVKKDTLSSYRDIPSNTLWAERIRFNDESYDYSNRFDLNTTQQTETSNSFIVPVTGVYHFDVGLELYYRESAAISNSAWIQVSLTSYSLVTGEVTAIYSTTAKKNSTLSSANTYEARISTDIKLKAGETLRVYVSQSNTKSWVLYVNPYSYNSFFSGHLVFAD